MVDIVVGCIVRGDSLERIPRKGVTTMVINSLDGRAREKPHSLPNGHARDKVGQSRPKSVKNEAFNRMIVQRSKGIRYIKSMVSRMECGVQPLVHVHGSM